MSISFDTKTAEGRPSRVVLNFAHRCALSCEWCYVPFNTPKADKAVVFAVIERIKALGFTSITLGGGDPFQYSFIGEVVRLAKGLGLNVHVDTHGRSLSHSTVNAELVTGVVDLIGLPLDGPTASIHDSMRGSIGHFDIVMRRLDWLKQIGAKVKINTMVSSQNLDHLLGLAQLIHKLNPWRWSIYQYWPLGPAQAVSETHSVDHAAFSTVAEEASILVRTNASTLVEVSEQLGRRSTYPIVYHDGSVNVHSVSETNSLTTICSIFDENARRRIDEACGPEREDAKSRYL